MLEKLQQLFIYREAVRTMVARDLTVRYSGSVLGIVWSLISPLMMAGIYTVVFTFLLQTGIERFPIFILCGVLPWNFFAGTVLGAGSSMVGNGHLISRVFFPRDILPVAVALANLVNFAMALGMLFAMALFYHAAWSWGALLWLPVVIAVLFLFSLGLGLILATINIYLRDAQQIMEVLLQGWFFLTPIIYSLDFIQTPNTRLLVKLANPMAALINALRDIVYSGRAPELPILAVTTAEAVGLAVVAYWIFHRFSPYFVEAL